MFELEKIEDIKEEDYTEEITLDKDSYNNVLAYVDASKERREADSKTIENLEAKIKKLQADNLQLVRRGTLSTNETTRDVDKSFANILGLERK